MKTIFAILIVLGVAGAGTYKWRQDKAEAEAAATPASVRIIEVERGTIDLRVATTGKVVSNLDVEIKSKASGQIVRLPFDISDVVSSGALLAELDPIDEDRNVAQQEAALVAARARLSQAQQQLEISQNTVDTATSTALAGLEAARVKANESKQRLERQEDLFRKRLISSEELDIARSEASASERALRQAEVEIAELRNLPRQVELRRQDVNLNISEVNRAEINMQNALQRLKETKIFSPMDGVVTSRPVQTGQIIASGISNVGGGTTLMTISDLSRIFVNANVDESDIGKIAVDQQATITADAYPGKRFAGQVVRVSSKGATNSNVVTFEVKIEVTGKDRDLLKPEMTANVDVQAERREDVLVLPNEAIQFGRSGYFVEVPAGNNETSTTRKQIVTGLTDGLSTEVVEGLEDGEKIALPSTMQSRWARGGSEAGTGDLTRGLQRAARSMGGGGGGSGGGRRGR